ncbi:MAG TPA: type II toxin-antitoxin system RelE/ParE family toxin [Spirochaetia bacterium]
MLDGIRLGDREAYRKIVDKIRNLKDSPEKQGRALLGPLKGLRRVVAAGRYRVLYRVEKEQVTVHVVAAGIRREGDKRDIYEIAQKLIRAKLL